MALGAEHVGRRVVVRRMLPGERGPSGGPAMTDVLGILDALTDDTLLVRRDDGEVVTVDRAEVVAAKPVPPRVAGPERLTAEALQVVCAAGWQAPVQEQLGDWLLRAGGGFTGRANSLLPVGDPGVPFDTALRRAGAFYARFGLPTQAQVVVGSAVMDELVTRGWASARPDEADALVQVAPLALPPRRLQVGSSERCDVQLSPSPGGDWLRRYGRSGGADPDLVTSLLESGDRVTFAQVGEPAVAIGRAVVTGRWVGLSAVEVEPELRRQGLGSVVVDALLAWGKAHGARSAYLQTLADNGAAVGLYARYGFRTHHSYRYLRPPGGSASSG
jgi:GNAT superfamily N-acetyltransferase